MQLFPGWATALLMEDQALLRSQLGLQRLLFIFVDPPDQVDDMLGLLRE